MKSTLFRSLALLLVLSPALAQAVAPANDKFAGATSFAARVGKARSQNGAAATGDALDPYLNGAKPVHSLWYRTDAPTFSAGNHISITHATPANVGIFELTDTDGGPGALTLVAQASFPAAGTDTFTFTTAHAARHYICVEAAGTFDLTVKIAGAANDFFEDAITLPGSQGTITGNNMLASNVGDEPAILPADDPASGIWYKWVAPASVQMGFDTNFSFLINKAVHDTKLAIFTGTSLSNLVTVTSDDDSGHNFNSRVSFAATAGTTYYIWVGSYSTRSGSLKVNFYPETNPGVFDIVLLSSTVSENQGYAQVQIRRRLAGTVSASVTINTANSSAIAGADYTAVSQVVAFASGGSTAETATHQEISIPILPDSLLETSETFSVTLSAPTAGATVGTASVSVSIIDTPPITCPGFTFTELRVKETDGFVSIPVTRSDSQGRVPFTAYTTTSLDATAARPGINYVNILGDSLAILPGTSSLILGLQILNNGRAEGDRFFFLNVDPDAPGVPVDGSRTIKIIIADDDALQPAPGRLSGLFTDSLFGSVDITVSATGSVTGKLILAKAAYPFTGKLSPAGSLTVNLAPVNGLPTRTLVLQLINSADRQYNVTLNDIALGGQSTLTLTATTFSTAEPCPSAGLYTFADQAGVSSPIVIPQVLAGSLKVDALGTATLSGKIFDGTAFVATGGVTASGIANIGANLYAGNGRFTSAIQLPTAAQTISNTNCQFLRPGRANQNVELPSISAPFIPAFVAIYTPPTVGTRILSVWNPAGAGFADLTGGGFGATTTQNIVVSTANVVSLSGAVIPSLKLTLVPATGLYTGTVIPPATALAKPIYGVTFQGGVNSIGKGFFLNSITPGSANLR